MKSQNYDDRTIERWRLEPRLSGLEFEDSPSAEQAPPLWKDLTLASVLALLLWLAAAAIFA
jgi:hypothetical protein